MRILKFWWLFAAFGLALLLAWSRFATGTSFEGAAVWFVRYLFFSAVLFGVVAGVLRLLLLVASRAAATNNPRKDRQSVLIVIIVIVVLVLFQKIMTP